MNNQSSSKVHANVELVRKVEMTSNSLLFGSGETMSVFAELGSYCDQREPYPIYIWCFVRSYAKMCAHDVCLF